MNSSDELIPATNSGEQESDPSHVTQDKTVTDQSKSSQTDSDRQAGQGNENQPNVETTEAHPSQSDSRQEIVRQPEGQTDPTRELKSNEPQEPSLQDTSDLKVTEQEQVELSSQTDNLEEFDKQVVWKKVSMEEDDNMEITEGQEVELMDTEDVETSPEEAASVPTGLSDTDQKDEMKGTLPEQTRPSQTSEKREKPALCYCGKGRNLDVVELQCSICMKWFHKDCLSINLGNCIPFMMSYTFCCKRCNPNNIEMYSRKVPNFSHLCYVVLANLTAQNRKTDPPKTMFSKDKDIIPFIDANWELLTPAQRRTTVTWHSTIVKAMMKDSDMFICKEKPDDPTESDEDYPLFGLLDQDLSKIGPNYDPRTEASQRTNNLSSSLNGNSGLLMTNVGRGRGAKKRGLDSSQNLGPNKKSKGDLNSSMRLSPHGYPLEHPYNKDGYRYTLTENDPHAPAALFDEDIWIGKPIPAHLYRKALPNQVLLALHDRAPQLKISQDRMSVTGDKGYSMVRATHGVKCGTWYFEATITELPENTGTRIGWSQALGNLQAPLGYDKFGYSWRSRKGTRFHHSRGKHYSDAYTEGDVVGCLISLPKVLKPTEVLPDTYKNRTLIKFKSHLYFEEKDEPTETEKSLQVAPGSKIVFFKNGVSQGTAFEDIYDGIYYPCISLYKGCSVSLNFGPDFKYPPEDLSGYKAISDLAEISQIEQTLADAIFHVEHEKMYEDAARGILVVF
ncbi:Set1/Ash2 histone methyltransferase complex subunit ASH2 [Holothuria leucospilota]|uniref:Set1/Ash2 histone methyltransferase complex subunit ASH2 n=1 Tax=Holothuria leucospilota TaxID=206669 RepID=A0A9Q1BFI9_HOLLE|nr:Set1/Ash2 histone methyltransferase complex subunit ASH2 [Holothuria leucospilota]